MHLFLRLKGSWFHDRINEPTIKKQKQKKQKTKQKRNNKNCCN